MFHIVKSPPKSTWQNDELSEGFSNYGLRKRQKCQNAGSHDYVYMWNVYSQYYYI